MEKFPIQFQNDNEKKIVTITLLIGIIFGFLAFGITAFCFNNDLSEQSKKIINAFLNFTLLLFIISVVMSFIPYINLLSILVSPVLWLINLIIILKTLVAIRRNNTEVEIPVILTIF